MPKSSTKIIFGNGEIFNFEGGLHSTRNYVVIVRCGQRLSIPTDLRFKGTTHDTLTKIRHLSHRFMVIF